MLKRKWDWISIYNHMLFPQVKELSKRNVNFWNLGLSFLYVSSLWYLLGDRLNDQPLSPSHGSPIKEFSIPWLGCLGKPLWQANSKNEIQGNPILQPLSQSHSMLRLVKSEHQNDTKYELPSTVSCSIPTYPSRQHLFGLGERWRWRGL